MAQKDIQDIALYMRQLNESKEAEDKAYDEALKEQEEFNAEEVDISDDEILNPESMGFIDDSDAQDESDDFYDEDEQKDSLEEDVSDCIEQEVKEAENLAKIDLNVYNEDGYGEYFARDLSKNVPGVDAIVVRTLPNGDLLVRATGSQPDLEKAWAFYNGKQSFADLDADCKDEFRELMTFDDGDTLSEADYREAVAHCLDPVGVKASTANLAGQDTCAISMIKEEKCKRAAKRMLKALRENDFSSLSDDDVEKLDAIKDANGKYEKMSPQHAAIWKQILKDMGYTEEEWKKLTPEQQDKAWNDMVAAERRVKSRTGFANYEPGEQPPRIEINDPKYGRVVTTWNPDYSQEDSELQHHAQKEKRERKEKEAQWQARLDTLAANAIKKSRGKDTWTVGDFAEMIQNLSGSQRKQLMNAMIDSVNAEASSSSEAGKAIQVIKTMFGKKQTLRDYAKAWGTSFPGVKLFADKVEGNLYTAAKMVTGMTNGLRALGVIATSEDKSLKQRFANEFEKLMNGENDAAVFKAAVRKDTVDPERRERALKAKAKAAATPNV